TLASAAQRFSWAEIWTATRSAWSSHVMSLVSAWMPIAMPTREVKAPSWVSARLICVANLTACSSHALSWLLLAARPAVYEIRDWVLAFWSALAICSAVVMARSNHAFSFLFSPTWMVSDTIVERADD